MSQDLNGDSFLLLGSILSCFYLENNENYVTQHSPMHQFVFLFSFQFFDLTSTIGYPWPSDTPEKVGNFFFFSKTLVLTLGSPPEMGGEKKQKKTLVLTLGRPPEKGQEKKKKKTMLLTLGMSWPSDMPERAGKEKKKKTSRTDRQPAEKGWKKKCQGQTARRERAKIK